MKNKIYGILSIRNGVPMVSLTSKDDYESTIKLNENNYFDKSCAITPFVIDDIHNLSSKINYKHDNAIGNKYYKLTQSSCEEWWVDPTTNTKRIVYETQD